MLFTKFSSVFHRISSERQITRYQERYFQIFSLSSSLAFYHQELLLQVSTNMSRTFRLFQTNHLPDKDVFMEVPDVEKINENSKKKKKKSGFAKDKSYS